MADFEQEVKGGTKRAVLHALAECILSVPEKPIPRWVKQGFAEAMYQVTSAQVASWDEVFGRPLPKGKHLAAKRRRLELRELVWRECMERRADGSAISDKSLFLPVAEKLGITTRQAREIFYELKEAGRPVAVRGRRFHGATIVAPKT